MQKITFIGLFLTVVAFITVPAFAKRHVRTDMDPNNSKRAER